MAGRIRLCLNPGREQFPLGCPVHADDGSSNVKQNTFVITEAEQAEIFLTEAYGSIRIDGWADGDPLRLKRTDLGKVLIDEIDNAGTYRYSFEPLGAILITTLSEGRLDRHTAGAQGSLSVGQPSVMAEPDRPYHGRLFVSSMNVVTLTPEQLSRSAGIPQGSEPGALRFETFLPVSETAGQHWRLVVAHVMAVADTTPDAFAEPLVHDSLVQLLHTAALTTFANSYLPLPHGYDRRDATPKVLQRAIGYLEANAHLPITVGDVALHCRVSVRTLQYAFRSRLAMSPMEYLRRVRLDRVHRDLITADPSNATVTAIASRWGFYNHGKFAEYYRSAYGRIPSHTLRA